MKANYLPKNSFNKPNYLKRILVVVVVFLFGAGAFYFFSTPLITLFAPVWKVGNSINQTFENNLAFFQNQKKLAAENAALKENLSSLELKVAALSVEQNQKNILLKLAGQKQNDNVITAAVLTQPPQTPYDVIIIDVGTNDAVTVGSAVYLPEGPMLGLVSEVFGKTAKVKLFSASGEETNAIFERDNIPITMTGAGGGNFKVSVPRDLKVEKGDRILSRDVGASLIAIVEDVSAEPTDSFKEVLAKSPTNIFVLRFVFVAP